MATNAACIFCKIVRGEIPSFKLFENAKVLAFLDVNPTSKGHALVIPKYHAERTHEIPDEYLSEVLPAARKVITGMIESGLPSDYNILQNNGAIAHQMVMHVHYHIIPKPNEEDGLGVEWPAKKADMAELKSLCEQIVSKM